MIRDGATARIDLAEILAMVRELAEYEREPDAVVLDPDEFARTSSAPTRSRGR